MKYAKFISDMFSKISEKSYLGSGFVFMWTITGIIVGAFLISGGVFVISAIVGFLLQLLFWALKLNNIAEKIGMVVLLIPMVSFVFCCIVLGAIEGIRGYKTYLKYCKDTSEEALPEENTNLSKLTQNGFIPRVYEWVKISRYAIAGDDYLIRFDEVLKDGFPVYQVLFEGWWEVNDACHAVSIRDINEAKPISFKKAEVIIKKQEKPLEQRPKERDNWCHC